MSGLPRIPADTPKGLRAFLESLRETIEVSQGQRGAPLQSSPTWQDLLDVGFLQAHPDLVLKTNGKTFTASDISNWVSVNLPDWATSTLNPPAPTGLVVAASVSNLVLSWNPWDSIFYGQTLVYRNTSNDLTTATLIGSTTGETYVDNLPPPGQNYWYWIRHESKGKRQGDFNDVNGTTVSNVVGQPSITYSFDGADLILAWPTPSSNLTVQFYRISYGDTYSTSVLVDVSNTNTARIPVNWQGDRTFWVVGVDVQNKVGLPSSVLVDVVPPDAPTVNQSVQNDALVLQFSATPHSLPIARYDVRYGGSYDTGAPLASASSSRFETAVNWAGSRNFWVAAIDTAGNVGVPTLSVFNPTPPSVVAPTVDIIDNNVLLRWSASLATLSLDYYKVYRNGVFYTSVSGRFAVIFEPVSGTFSYGISAVDVAGNEGPQAPISATVKQPPDFVLFSSVDSGFAGTKTTCYKDPADNSLICNVDASESWAAHFSSRGWSNIQDQINAGYTSYAVGKTTGSYREDIDYGATIPSTNITMTVNTAEQPSGPVTVSGTISTGTDGSTYPNTSSGFSAFMTAFRYVRYDLSFAATHDGTGLATDTSDIIKIKPLNYRLDLRLKTKEYFVSAVSTDVGGTVQSISGEFIDVQSIAATVIGSSAAFAVIDFTDTANPTQFKVLAYNTSGSRISATVGVILRGV